MAARTTLEEADRIIQAIPSNARKYGCGLSRHSMLVLQEAGLVKFLGDEEDGWMEHCDTCKRGGELTLCDTCSFAGHPNCIKQRAPRPFLTNDTYMCGFCVREYIYDEVVEESTGTSRRRKTLRCTAVFEIFIDVECSVIP